MDAHKQKIAGVYPPGAGKPWARPCPNPDPFFKCRLGEWQPAKKPLAVDQVSLGQADRLTDTTGRIGSTTHGMQRALENVACENERGGESPRQKPGNRRFLFRFCGMLDWRMLTANPDGSDVRIIDDNGLTSHFIWRDPQHILAWSRQPSHDTAFYLFEDQQGGSIEAVGPDVMPRDGHCSYLPDRDWIVNDDGYNAAYGKTAFDTDCRLQSFLGGILL